MRQSPSKEAQLAAAVRYVRKRGAVYQYERRVPERVKRNASLYAENFGSKPLFRRSLHTSDPVQMHLACVGVHQEFERKLAISSGITSSLHLKSEISLPAHRPVTQSDLDDIAERYRRVTFEPMQQAYIKADISPIHAAEFERLVYELELDSEDEVRALGTRGTGDGKFETPADIAKWLVEIDGWDAPPGSSNFGAIVGAIRAGIQKGREEVGALIEGKTVPHLIANAPKAREAAVRLSTAVESYLQQKQLPTRTETEVRSTMRLFAKVIGDKRLDALSRKDFQEFAKHLASQTVGGQTAGSIQRAPSRATLRKRIGLLRAVINHAIETGQFSGLNPASGIKVEAFAAPSNPAIMPKKRRFSIDEMNLIFQHPWFTGCASPSQTHVPGNHRLQGAEYWAPVMAALTGCRASELGGLMLSEIILPGPCPHIIIRDNKYRRTKTGNARKVPVLDALIDLGFNKYVETVTATGADRLFPDWTPPKAANSGRNDDKQWSNGKIIRAFNRTVVPKMLGARLPADARLEVTFHGFRGAFKAMLGGAEYRLHPNIINEVIGHAKLEMDQRYVGELTIDETYPAIHSCRYHGLNIPSR